MGCFLFGSWFIFVLGVLLLACQGVLLALSVALPVPVSLAANCQTKTEVASCAPRAQAVHERCVREQQMVAASVGSLGQTEDACLYQQFSIFVLAGYAQCRGIN